jgi:hypothetical protein
VYGLTPDAACEYRFASYEVAGTGVGGSAGLTGGVVRLWDTRKSGEVLHFGVGGGILGLEWQGRGKLGVGTKDGVGIWEIIDGRKVDVNGTDEWTCISGMRNGTLNAHAWVVD